MLPTIKTTPLFRPDVELGTGLGVSRTGIAPGVRHASAVVIVNCHFFSFHQGFVWDHNCLSLSCALKF